MEVNKAFIGTSTDPFTVEIEKGSIRRFAEAIQDPNPMYYDINASRQMGFRNIVAPPTFPTTFRPPHGEPWLAGLDQARYLAGEQYFKYERPIVAGDILECRVFLVGIEEKQGRSGRMQLLIQELRALDSAGNLVVTNGRVVIYRSADSVGSGSRTQL